MANQELTVWQKLLIKYYPDVTSLTYLPDEGDIYDVLFRRGLNSKDADFLARSMVTWAKGEEFLLQHPLAPRKQRRGTA